MILSGVVARYVDAWNAHDAMACADCFTADGERIWMVFSPPQVGGEDVPHASGREAVAQGIAAFLWSVPDVQVDVVALSEGSDDRIWTEWQVTGTHERDWGRWPARGARVDSRGVSIFSIAAGGIALERMYWDTLLMTGEPAALSR